MTIFSCVERFCGFIYRVFLSRTIGSEGVGLYQIALSVLGLFMTVTSSGIPITVSRTMIKYKEEGHAEKTGKVVTGGIFFAVVISLPITLLVLLKCPVVGLLFSDPRCESLLRIMIPGLTITSVYAVIRGTFWGNTQFLTYSVIELLEEAVMVVVGIILVNGITDPMQGATYAAYAVLISYIFSFVTSVITYFVKGGKLKSPAGELKPLFASATPITAMRTATSVINTLVAVLLPARLIRYGMSGDVAVSEFGRVYGMAMPLVFMPSTFIGSLALVLVPELSSNYYSGNYKTLKNNIEKAIKFSVFIVSLIIPPFLVLGRNVGNVIYADEIVGDYVRKGAITMLPMSLSIITTSILNSLNKEKRTLVYYLIGASALILSIMFLPKYLGVSSLILGMILSFSATAALNLIATKKVCPKKPQVIGYIAAATLIMLPSALFGLFLKGLLSKYTSDLLLLIVVTSVMDLFALIAFKVFGLLDFDGKNQSLSEKNFTRFKAGKRTNKRV